MLTIKKNQNTNNLNVTQKSFQSFNYIIQIVAEREAHNSTHKQKRNINSRNLVVSIFHSPPIETFCHNAAMASAMAVSEKPSSVYVHVSGVEIQNCRRPNLLNI